jgi:serpin B
MLGTKGESESQIKQALGVSGIADPHKAYKELHNTLTGTSNYGPRLAIANRIFLKLGLDIKEEYKKESLAYYNSAVELLDFVGNSERSRRRINTWVEEQTEEKIKDLIPEGGINTLSVIVLTNAIYFKGDWKIAFPSLGTKKEPFHISETNKGTVAMMHIEKKKWLVGISDSLDCKVLSLSYKGEKLSMIIMLPNKVDGLPKLELSLSLEAYKEIVTKMFIEDAIVSIPKFKLESSFQLENILSKMGIANLFSRKADFGAMMEDPPENTFVSSVSHKAFVEVNEQGTVAAEATAMSMMGSMCMPQQPLVFNADHPFLFFIRENSTRSILFIGRFTDPTNC